MVSAIIMASGYSKRMGKNKLLLKYKGKSFLEHTIDMILACDFSEVILVAREEEIIKIGEKRGLKVIENKDAEKGMSESVKLGVKHAKDSEGYMFFTGDQPFLDCDIIKKLLFEFRKDKSCIVSPSYKGRRGNPTLFSKKFKEDFLQLTGDIGGRKIINQNIEKVVLIEIEDDKKLFDVDTEEDYEKILKW